MSARDGFALAIEWSVSGPCRFRSSPLAQLNGKAGSIEQRTRAPHGALTLSHEPETLHPNAPARDHPDYFDGRPAQPASGKNEKAIALHDSPGTKPAMFSSISLGES